MKGVTEGSLWVVISLIVAIITIAIFVLFSPAIIENLTLFAARVFEWLKHLV